MEISTEIFEFTALEKSVIDWIIANSTDNTIIEQLSSAKCTKRTWSKV
jgi:hypothetical protein